MTTAAIGLGANLGDRPATLAAAVEAIADLGEIRAVSQWYESAPIGGPDQGAFLNGVVVLDTALGARELVDRFLAIEAGAGRVRRERWGPRVLDIDLLLHGDTVIDEPGLTVPHPRMIERRFVLEPLLEVWPDAALPDGTRLETRLAAVGDQEVWPWPRDGSERTLAAALNSVAFLVPMVIAILLLWWGLGWVIDIFK